MREKGGKKKKQEKTNSWSLKACSKIFCPQDN